MNPRAATNDLLPFQGSPFNHLGTSAWLKNSNYQIITWTIFLIQRREWDSNPRALADKRFSRPPRYDHFDISPNVLVYYIKLFSVCQELFKTFFEAFLSGFFSGPLFKRLAYLIMCFSFCQRLFTIFFNFFYQDFS